jgi:hypothetical protein
MAKFRAGSDFLSIWTTPLPQTANSKRLPRADLILNDQLSFQKSGCPICPYFLNEAEQVT